MYTHENNNLGSISKTNIIRRFQKKKKKVEKKEGHSGLNA